MTTYNNPALRAGITPAASGAIYLDRQVTDLADPRAVPAAIAAADLVQIGVIPAGATLVPELSTLHLPVFDTNGEPTAKATVGTADVTTAIASEQTLSGAVVHLRGSSLSYSSLPDGTTALGSESEDIPIYLAFTAKPATQAATGKVVADLAFRAYRPKLDPAA